MNAHTNPVRDSAPAVTEAGPPIIITQPTTPVPADPAVILARQAGPQPKKHNWLLWGIGGAVAAQIVMPLELTPTVLAGNAASGFYGAIMGTSTGISERHTRCNILSGRLADLEGRRADALGNCIWGIIGGQEGIQLCRMAVEARFSPSISETEQSLRNCPRGFR